MIYTVDATGHVGIGITPTAWLQIQAGSSVAGTSPLKLTSGPLLSSPEVGAFEFLTDALYFSQTTNISRHPVAWQDNPLGQQIFS